MNFPTLQYVVDSLLTHVGWGTLGLGILTFLGFILRFLWTLTTNHAEHIQAACESANQKAEMLIFLAQRQLDASKDTAVTLAEIKTLLSVK